MCTSYRKRFLRAISLILVASQLVVYGPALHANPLGGTVAAGRATIHDASALTTITQSTDKAIINWRSFSNAAHETVRFTQPAVTSVTLNRVVGVDPSSILGAMQANGRIFLINPNGVVLGPGSRIDVGGLVASTLALSDQDFLRGNYSLVQDPERALAAVINKGRITTPPGGYVALVAPIVNNEGQIVAAAGRVVLAGTTRAEVSLDSEGLVSVHVPVAKLRDVIARQGDVSDLLSSAVNSGDIVEAGSVQVRDGRIVLAAAEGLAVNQGTISVDGAPGRAAGRVHIEGTQATVLAPGSTISASGRGAASAGGQVHALSAGRTVFAPTARIEARGGDTGDGGFVELSGQRAVTVRGDVDTRAPGGKTGTLLIDPTDIVIVSGSGGANDATLGDGSLDFFEGSGTYTISEQKIESMATNVILSAINTITINDVFDNVIKLLDGMSITLETLGLTGPGDIRMLSPWDRIETSGTGGITIQAGMSGLHTTDIVLGKLRTYGGPIEVRNYGTAGTLTVSQANASGRGLVTLVSRHGDILADWVQANMLRAHAGGDITLHTGVQRLDATAGSAETGTGSITVRQDGDVVLGTVTAGGDISIRVTPVGIWDILDVVLGTGSGGIVSGRNVSLEVGAGTTWPHTIRDGQPDGLTNIAAQDELTLFVHGLVPTIGSPANPLELVSGAAPSLSAAAVYADVSGPDVRIGLLEAMSGIISLYSPTGAVVDANGSASNLIAPAAAVVSLGSVGTTENAVETRLESLFATSAQGGVFAVEHDGLALTTITAATDVEVLSHSGDIGVGSATAGGTIRLTAEHGSLLDINDVGGSELNLAATGAVLTSAGWTGQPSNPLETRLEHLDATGVHGVGIFEEDGLATSRDGGVWIVEQDGLHIARVRAEGDVDIRTVTGDILLGRVVSGGSIRLEAGGTGSILDANGDLVNLIRRTPRPGDGQDGDILTPLIHEPTAGGAIDSYLIAGGVIGIMSDAIEVRIENGTLWTGARGMINCVSVNLAGEVAPENGLDLMWNPPGDVYWNGVRVYQGCRRPPITPQGEEEEPLPGPSPGPLEPLVPVAPVVPLEWPEPPASADPTQQLKTLQVPTDNVTRSRPKSAEEVERERKQLIDTSQMPDAD